MRRFILILPLCFFCCRNGAGGESREGVLRGPLRISADETVSKERGKIIEASGKVSVHYLMESGDRIESSSRFARYDEEEKTGRIYGSPKAKWKRLDPNTPETLLIADEILLKIKEEGLIATGNVSVFQGSSTLKAQEIRFLNSEKRLIARGGRPEFDVKQDRHHTRISAEEIVALTENKQINFNRKVHGVVELIGTAK